MGLGSIKNLSDKEWKNKYISSFLLSSNRMPFSESVNSKLLTTQGAKSFEEEINEKYFDSFSDNVTDQNLYGWFLHLYNSFHWQGSTVRGMMTSPEHYNLKNGSPFVIDLTKIDFLDSSGLGALVQTAKECKKLKLGFSVIGNSRVAQTIKLVRLGDFLNLKSSLEDALKYLKN